MHPYRETVTPRVAQLSQWYWIGMTLAFLALGACLGQLACTPAQGAKLQAGIPDDVNLAWCIIDTALSTGGNVAAVALACKTDAMIVVADLYSAATLPPATSARGSGLATHEMVQAATTIRTSQAFIDASLHYSHP